MLFTEEVVKLVVREEGFQYPLKEDEEETFVELLVLEHVEHIEGSHAYGVCAHHGAHLICQGNTNKPFLKGGPSQMTNGPGNLPHVFKPRIICVINLSALPLASRSNSFADFTLAWTQPCLHACMQA